MCGTGGFTDDQFGFDVDQVWRGFARQFLQEHPGGGAAHLLKRLPDGGEAWNLIGRGLDVVKAEDGDIGGNAESGLVQCADAAHGGYVVEAENSSEALSALDEVSDAGVADLRRMGVLGEIDHEVFMDLKTDFASYLERRVPAGIRVGAEGLAMHEGDPAMAEFVEMAQGKTGCVFFIEYDVRNAG